MMKHHSTQDFSSGTFACLTAVLLTACGLQTTQVLPKVSEEKPPAGKCLIVVERTKTSLGAWVNQSVTDNGKTVGSLGSGGKLAWLRDPGPMKLCFQGPGEFESAGPGQYYNGKDLAVVAGKKYHYKAGFPSLSVGFHIDGPGTPIIARADTSQGNPAGGQTPYVYGQTLQEQYYLDQTLRQVHETSQMMRSMRH